MHTTELAYDGSTLKWDSVCGKVAGRLRSYEQANGHSDGKKWRRRPLRPLSNRVSLVSVWWNTENRGIVCYVSTIIKNNLTRLDRSDVYDNMYHRLHLITIVFLHTTSYNSKGVEIMSISPPTPLYFLFTGQSSLNTTTFIPFIMTLGPYQLIQKLNISTILQKKHYWKKPSEQMVFPHNHLS